MSKAHSNVKEALRAVHAVINDSESECNEF